MMRKTLVLLLALTLIATVALAVPNLTRISGEITMPPGLDTYDDTLVYDDGTIMWWYGGLSNFKLATKFTPLTQFEMQQILIAFIGTGPVDLYLKDDVGGLPGNTLWSGSLNYSSSTTWLPTYVDTNGVYVFNGGVDFWIEAQSPGPPYEMFDASPTIPQRSYYTTTTVWNASPGDNFIRAVGENVGGPIVDVGVDSVWHDENFFLPNGDSFVVGCQVHNYGEAPAIFEVGCVIYTELGEENYVFFDSLAVQSAMLAPGATTNITFPSFTWNVDDRYKIDCRAYMTGDIFPDNNIESIETQTYTLSARDAELRYDDDTIDGHAYSSTVGMGWGMKFDPHQPGSYNLNQIKVEVSYSAGDLAARVKILADDGDDPGTTLWETVQVMANGWNTFDINVNHSGAFYIFYIFENGASTSALGNDGYPRSGQAWEVDAGVYAPDPAQNDWAMRAIIGPEGAYPDVTIDMDYVSGSPVPSGGGPIVYEATVTNNEASSQTFDAWITVLPPGMSEITLANRGLTLSGGGQIMRQLTLNVPGGAPSGTYTMSGYVGDHPSVIWNQSSFDFTKSGDGDGGSADPASWTLDGWDEPWEPTAVPTGFAVLGSYPNPFNPSTTISFTLDNSNLVKLQVFDISGREVATLVDGYRDAGPHEVTFDASGLASGIYVYRLTSSGRTISAKIVLMK